MRDPGKPLAVGAARLQGNLRLDRSVTSAEPGHARLLITGVVEEVRRRKLTGCLEDATLDRVKADVVSMSLLPVSQRSGSRTGEGHAEARPPEGRHRHQGARRRGHKEPLDKDRERS